MDDTEYGKHFEVVQDGFRTKNNLPENWTLEDCTDTEIIKNFAWYLFGDKFIPLVEMYNRIAKPDYIISEKK